MEDTEEEVKEKPKRAGHQIEVVRRKEDDVDKTVNQLRNAIFV